MHWLQRLHDKVRAFDAIRLHRDLPECSKMVRSEDKFKAILPLHGEARDQDPLCQEGEVMHELGIVFHIIRTAEDVARQNDVTRIRRVTLQLGEVSGVKVLTARGACPTPTKRCAAAGWRKSTASI
ncbi:MAG: hydrogenase/urease maturation nickel metallochaperone HypA [Gemmiger formicilis]|uniref:hydrogenase/urease maturation nickel metallochaperone HypA n=1 Tax=Gemmiger formicilis TaxID=745368 RepID=UPI0039A2F012